MRSSAARSSGHRGVGARRDADVVEWRHGTASMPERGAPAPCGDRGWAARAEGRPASAAIRRRADRPKRTGCLAGLPCADRRLHHASGRARRVQRLPTRDHDRRAARRRSRGPRRGRHLRRRGPRRVPARAAPGRGAGHWTGSHGSSAAWTCSRTGRRSMEAFRQYRRWAFESAALDLALRQQGQSLGAALGLPVSPGALRRLHAPRHRRRGWQVDPALEFKLDPTPGVGRGDDAAHRRHRPRARPRLQVVLRRLAGGQSAGPGPVRGGRRRSSPTPSSRTRRSPARRARRSTGRRIASASTRPSTRGPTSTALPRDAALPQHQAVALRVAERAARAASSAPRPPG